MTTGKPKKIPPPVSSFPLYSRENAPSPVLDFTSGAVFLIDKPKGWTSFRVVGLLRKLTGIKRTGHAGTLDPMATGLLIVCCGKATKSISLIQDGIKTYVATIQFGTATDSYDAEGEITRTSDFTHITKTSIQNTLNEYFSGEIEQLPPMFSALQHKGQRLYTLARKGITVERAPRKITIYRQQVISYNDIAGTALVEITCSKGTYIRSIAHDLAQKLDTDGHLIALRRTVSGDYSVENALDVHQLTKYFEMHGKIDLS